MVFDTELQALVRAHRPRLLAIGEPYHGEPAFPHLRNRILETLVGHGFRSIAIESDRAAGLAVNDYVQGRRDEVDLSTGISHGWGTHPASRELVDWLRAHNEKLLPDERVTFHGFDAPTEITGAPSPGPMLRELRDYLGESVSDLDGLVGAEERWTAPEIMYDATQSPGRSREATTLRGIAEDFRRTPRPARLRGDGPPAAPSGLRRAGLGQRGQSGPGHRGGGDPAGGSGSLPQRISSICCRLGRLSRVAAAR